MSGFEDNPFGEPMVDNPFADPAVLNARNTSTIPNQSTLDNYNPFENDNQRKPAQSQPAVVHPSQAVPAYNKSGQQYTAPSGAQILPEELQRQREELDRKAAEIERREQELQNNTSGVRRNNWPPLPDQCCFQPCFYHDITLDIPPDFQSIVTHLYRLWILYAAVMCANVIGGLILMFHAGQFSQFALSIFYAFLFTPASFLCWYRPAYKAFQTDSSFNFMVFFFIFFFQMIVTIIQTIGLPDSGMCGFITAIGQFDSTFTGVLVGLILLSIAIGFGVCAAGDIMLLTKIHSIYRSGGGSMQKAQAEFTGEFMQNRHVQNAAAGAVREAVRTQFNDRY